MSPEPNKDVLEDDQAVRRRAISPKDLLIFAKWILFFLAVLFALGALCEMIRPASTIFEACKTILPPIATLVIGYYFGKSSDS